MPYRLVFDLAAQPPPPTPLAILPLLFVVVCGWQVFKPDAVTPLWGRNAKGPPPRAFSWFCFLVACTITLVVLAVPVLHWYRLRQAPRQVSEGCLQSFQPVPSSGHGDERIRLDGQSFAYSDDALTPAFHRTQARGGPIHADSRVRLSHAGPDIVRVEVMDSACPAAADAP